MTVSTISEEELIDRLSEIVKRGWIPNNRGTNVGAMGNTLEDLLGLTENNLPIPNAGEWELKTQNLETTSLVTLFHCEPSPTACKFVPNVLLPHYGWAHEKAGTKYDVSERSFRQTIHAGSWSNRGFRVVIDRSKQKVVVSFDSARVDSVHADWLASVAASVGLNELNPQPYWGFESLEHKVGAKLNNCFFVQGIERKSNGRREFAYQQVWMLRGLSFDGFLWCLEKGTVLVDFDARTGHNHGTKFRLRPNHWLDLYREQTRVV